MDINDFDSIESNMDNIISQRKNNPILSVSKGILKGVSTSLWDKFTDYKTYTGILKQAGNYQEYKAIGNLERSVESLSSMYSDVKSSASDTFETFLKLSDKATANNEKLNTKIKKIKDSLGIYDFDTSPKERDVVKEKFDSLLRNTQTVGAVENGELTASFQKSLLELTGSQAATSNEAFKNITSSLLLLNRTNTNIQMLMSANLRLNIENKIKEDEHRIFQRDVFTSMLFNLKAIAHNTSLPDTVKQNSKVTADMLNRKYSYIGKGVNYIYQNTPIFKKLGDTIKANITDNLNNLKSSILPGLFSALNDTKDGISQYKSLLKDKLEMEGEDAVSEEKGNSIGSIIGSSLGFLLAKLIPQSDAISNLRAGKSKYSKKYYKALNFFTDPNASLNELVDIANRAIENGDTNHPVFKHINKLIDKLPDDFQYGARYGISDLLRNIKTPLAQYNKFNSNFSYSGLMAAVPFTRRTEISINEVIPGYLSRILQQITILRTGDNKTPLYTYDAKSSKFINNTRALASIRKTITKNMDVRGYRRELDTFEDYLKEKGISDDNAKKLSTLALKVGLNGGRLNPDSLNNKLYTNHLSDIEKLSLKEDLNNIFSDPKEMFKFNSMLSNVNNNMKSPFELIETLYHNGYKNELQKLGIIKHNKGGYVEINRDKLASYVNKDKALSGVNGSLATISPKNNIRDVLKLAGSNLDKDIASNLYTTPNTTLNEATASMDELRMADSLKHYAAVSERLEKNRAESISAETKWRSSILELLTSFKSNFDGWSENAIDVFVINDLSPNELDKQSRTRKHDRTKAYWSRSAQRIRAFKDSLKNNLVSKVKGFGSAITNKVSSIKSFSWLGEIVHGLNTAKNVFGHVGGIASQVFSLHNINNFMKTITAPLRALWSGMSMVKKMYNKYGKYLNPFKIAKNLASFAWTIGTSPFKYASKVIYKSVCKVEDIYILDSKEDYTKLEPEPVLTIAGFNRGNYYLKNGKIVKTPCDIKGPVYDTRRNILITDEDIRRGIYNKNGIRVKLPYTSNLLTKINKGIRNSFRRVYNIAVKPLLYTGKLLTKGIWGTLKLIPKGISASIKALFKTVKFTGDVMIDLFSLPFKIASAGIQAVFAQSFYYNKKSYKVAIDSLAIQTKIYELLLDRLPKKQVDRNSTDSSEEIRTGNWWDSIKSKVKSKTKTNSNTKSATNSALLGSLGSGALAIKDALANKLGGLFGGKGSGDNSSSGGIIDTAEKIAEAGGIAALGKNILGKVYKPGILKNILSKAGDLKVAGKTIFSKIINPNTISNIASKGSETIGAARGIFSKIINPETLSGAVNAAKGTISAIGSRLGGGAMLDTIGLGASRLIPTISATYGLFKIGQLGRSIYKAATSSRVEFMFGLRLKMYGFKEGMQTSLLSIGLKTWTEVSATLKSMEGWVARYVSQDGTNYNISIPDQSLKSGISAFFNVNMNSPDDVKRYANITKWLNERFIPAYLMIYSTLIKIAPNIRITDMDSNLNYSDKFTFLTQLKPQVENNKQLFSTSVSPFSDFSINASAIDILTDIAKGLTQFKILLMQSKNKAASTQNVASAVITAAQQVGVNPSLLLTMGAMESGLNPNAQASTSNAAGVFQFIPSTWRTMTSKYGSPGMNPYNPYDNSLMAAHLLKDNDDYLRSKLGIEPTPVDSYFAHFLGNDGAVKMLSASNGDIAANINPTAAQANTSIFYKPTGEPRTVGELKQLFTSRMMKASNDYNTGLQLSSPGMALASSNTQSGYPNTSMGASNSTSGPTTVSSTTTTSPGLSNTPSVSNKGPIGAPTSSGSTGMSALTMGMPALSMGMSPASIGSSNTPSVSNSTLPSVSPKSKNGVSIPANTATFIQASGSSNMPSSKMPTVTQVQSHVAYSPNTEHVMKASDTLTTINGTLIESLAIQKQLLAIIVELAEHKNITPNKIDDLISTVKGTNNPSQTNSPPNKKHTTLKPPIVSVSRHNSKVTS